MSDELTGNTASQVPGELGIHYSTVLNRIKHLKGRGEKIDKKHLYPTDIEKIANYRRGSSEGEEKQVSEQKPYEPKTRKPRERKIPYEEGVGIKIGDVYLSETGEELLRGFSREYVSTEMKSPLLLAKHGFFEDFFSNSSHSFAK